MSSRLLPFAVLPLVAGLFALAPRASGDGAVCSISAPASAALSVQLCLTTPADGATITGEELVTATVAVTPATKVKFVRFTLDGGYVLTDRYGAAGTFAFVLPSTAFADGVHVLSAKATVGSFVSDPASISLIFAGGGPVSGPATFVPTAGSSPSPGAPVVVASVGDGADGSPAGVAVASLAASWSPNLFLYLGDVYDRGTVTEFRNWYGARDRWDALHDVTDPTVGDKEYGTADAAGYMDHWGQPPHSYSVDVAGWHVVSLDSSSQYAQVAAGTAQYDWLAADLQASAADCTIVALQNPRYSNSAIGGTPRLADLWSLLAANGVDIVLAGDSHTYQRWVPLDGAGNPAPAGVTEFVVGTGGRPLQRLASTIDPRIAVRSSKWHGALRLELGDGSAAYTFVRTPSPGTARDSGTISCSPAV